MSGLRFFFALVLPFLVGVALLEPRCDFSAFAFVFIGHPFLDFLFPREKLEIPAKNQSILDSFLVVYAMTQTSLLVEALLQTHSLGFRWGLLVSVGAMTGAIGITAAHEMIHRRNPFFRRLGHFLLLQVLYPHFRIEHVYGHHSAVGMHDDPASAREGESLYRFWVRSIFTGVRSAYEIEKMLVQREKRRFNRTILDVFLGILILIGLWQWGGPTVVGFFVGQALVAILLLETVNYVEHYGLKREGGAILAAHSWDSNWSLTNSLLFNLGKHSHHHLSPSAPFHQLKLHEKAAPLPFGYSVAMLIALIPPLWFRRMDRELKRVRDLR